MSKQRAIVNCERCFGLLEDILNTSKDEKNIHLRILNSNSVYISRNNAMKALEDGNKGKNDSIYNQALNACLNCDYKSPKIKEVLEEKYFKK